MNKEEQKEFNRLEKEIRKIRKGIQKVFEIILQNNKNKKYFEAVLWEQIDNVIDYEIEQESYCNQ